MSSSPATAPLTPQNHLLTHARARARAGNGPLRRGSNRSAVWTFRKAACDLTSGLWQNRIAVLYTQRQKSRRVRARGLQVCRPGPLTRRCIIYVALYTRICHHLKESSDRPPSHFT